MPFESTFVFLKALYWKKSSFCICKSLYQLLHDKLSRDLYKTNAIEKHSFFMILKLSRIYEYILISRLLYQENEKRTELLLFCHLLMDTVMELPWWLKW